MNKNESALKKVVYFDQSSAIDYLQIVNKGKKQEKTEKTKTIDGGGKAEANVSPNKLLKKIMPAAIELDASGNAQINVVKNTIVENSLLFEFIDTYEKEGQDILEDYNLEIVKKSASYYASIAPVAEMLDGSSKIDEEMSVRADKMFSALKAFKGYYEILAKKNDEEIVLRFNLNSFRNNYRLQDLTKMSLKLFVIKVGKMSLEDLDFNNQIDSQDDIDETDFDGFAENIEKYNNSEDQNQKLYDVYDVYLAGV